MRRAKALAAAAAQAKARAGAQAKSRTQKQERAEPTIEQRLHANYVEQDIVDVLSKGRVTIGKAYRRQARFETIEGLGTDQLKALRAYRAAFDASERSEVKSALDIRPRNSGGSHGALAAIEAKAFATIALRQIESQLGALVHTMRDVVLMDMTFSDVAMKRFGAREVDYIDVGKGKRKPRSLVKLAPKSGTHRQIVRDEFLAGLALLTQGFPPGGQH